jgi:hypothetical protein
MKGIVPCTTVEQTAIDAEFARYLVMKNTRSVRFAIPSVGADKLTINSVLPSMHYHHCSFKYMKAISNS